MWHFPSKALTDTVEMFIGNVSDEGRGLPRTY